MQHIWCNAKLLAGEANLNSEMLAGEFNMIAKILARLANVNGVEILALKSSHSFGWQHSDCYEKHSPGNTLVIPAVLFLHWGYFLASSFNSPGQMDGVEPWNFSIALFYL